MVLCVDLIESVCVCAGGQGDCVWLLSSICLLSMLPSAES